MSPAILSMQRAVSLMRIAVDALVPPVPATDAELDAIDDALAEAFQEPVEEIHLCGYCGEPSDGRWCSSACRAADAYDGQWRSER
jgi:hypothetical protein